MNIFSNFFLFCIKIFSVEWKKKICNMHQDVWWTFPLTILLAISMNSNRNEKLGIFFTCANLYSASATPLPPPTIFSPVTTRLYHLCKNMPKPLCKYTLQQGCGYGLKLTGSGSLNNPEPNQDTACTKFNIFPYSNI